MFIASMLLDSGYSIECRVVGWRIQQCLIVVVFIPRSLGGFCGFTLASI